MEQLFLCIILMVMATATASKGNQEIQTNGQFRPLIVGGSAAPLGSVPHQVSLLSGGVDGPYIGCGGSILNENYILTAAHCAVAANSFGVRAGFNSLSNPEPGHQTVAVSEIIVHEDYDDFTYYNDIALLRLATPLELDRGLRTAAIKIPGSGYEVTGDVTVTGWGYTKEGSGQFSNNLQTLTLTVVSDDDCRDAYGQDEILDSMLCAGFPAGGQGSCQGDSGGPVVEDSSGLLVGIVSYGDGCGKPGFPDVNAETSHYEDWIKKHMT